MKNRKWWMLFLMLPIVAWGQPSFGPSYGPAGFHGNVLPKPNTDSVNFTIPPYESWLQQPWRNQLYRFPEFQEGRIQFATGFSTESNLKLNYNRFFETVDVWTEDGSWSPLKRSTEIKYVWMGPHKFLFDHRHGFMEVIEQGNVALGIQTFIYGLLEDSNGLKTAIIGLENRDATVRGTRYYWTSERYFIIGPDNEVLRASPQALPKLLPSISQEVTDYIALEQINFRSKDDLLKVIRFCNSKSIKLPKKERTLLYVPLRTEMKETVLGDSVYSLPTFTTNAVLQYSDGERTNPNFKVNFSRQTNTLEMITAAGDTTELDNSDPISYAVLDGKTFYNHPYLGWLEVLTHGNLGLAMVKRLTEHPVQESGRKIILMETSYYYYKDDRIMPASASTLLKLVPNRKKKIKDYVARENPDFNKRADAEAALQFALINR